MDLSSSRNRERLEDDRYFSCHRYPSVRSEGREVSRCAAERVVGVYVIKKKVRVENTALAASKDTEESGERAGEREKGREAEVEEVDEGVDEAGEEEEAEEVER